MVLRRKLGESLVFTTVERKKVDDWFYFFKWLQWFDTYIYKTSNSIVLLLVHIFSAHGNDETLPVLHYVQTKFLPPNSTSRLHINDVRIINSIYIR